MAEDILEKARCDKDFDIQSVWNCEEDIRSLKSLILFGLKGMAAYAHHARALGYKDHTVDKFFYEALRAIASDLSLDELLSMVLRVGEVNLKCMELLDKANTDTYGDPVPTKAIVETNVRDGCK